MTECGLSTSLLIPLELKKEIVEDKEETNPHVAFETENLSPLRQSPQETDEETDFKLMATDADGNVNVLAKESAVALPPVITVSLNKFTQTE